MKGYCYFVTKSAELRKKLNELDYIGKRVKRIVGYGEDTRCTILSMLDSYNKNSDDTYIRLSIDELPNDYESGFCLGFSAIGIEFNDKSKLIIVNYWPNGIIITDNDIHLSETNNLDTSIIFKEYIGKEFTGFKVITNKKDDQPLSDFTFIPGQFKSLVLYFDRYCIYKNTGFSLLKYDNVNDDYENLMFDKSKLNKIFRNKLQFDIDKHIIEQMKDKDKYARECSWKYYGTNKRKIFRGV